MGAIDFIVDDLHKFYHEVAQEDDDIAYEFEIH